MDPRRSKRRAVAGICLPLACLGSLMAMFAAPVVAAPTDGTFTTNLATDLGSCPNEALRTGPSAFLPECRAYEMVSPVDKNGEAIYPEGNSQATSDGEGIAFLSRGAFAGAPGSVIFNTYIARRDATGWTTSSPDAPQYNGSGLIEIPTSAFDRDLGKALEASRRALAPGAIEGGSNLYLRDNSTGVLTTVLAVPGERSFAAFSEGQKVFAGASTDWSRIFIEDEAQIDGEGTNEPSGQGTNLYELSAGSIHLVSGLPGGEAEHGVTVDHAGRPVSEDGRRVYFSDEQTGVLYLHEVGAGTRAVSAEQRAGAEQGTLAPAGAPYADADGGEVFFSATEGLAEGPAGAGTSTLYRYDAADGELVEITSGAAEGAGVAAILGSSADGQTVYFAASGGFGGAAPAEFGTANLYVWTAGEGIRLIGTTEAAAEESSGPITARVSQDGRYLAFDAFSLLTPDAVASSHCPGGPGISPAERCGEVYEYDLDADRLTCVSCTGRPDLAGASIGGAYRPLFSEYQPRALLEDGVVFFQTANPISSRDSNGQTDVYEWRDGGAQLISSGTSEEGSYFADASADRHDVFFKTSQSLVGQDADGRYDLYDARIGGGLASQAAKVTDSCEGEACRGASPAPPGFNPPVFHTCSASTARARRAARAAVSLRRRLHEAKGPKARHLRRKAAASHRKAKRLKKRADLCGRAGR